MNDANPNDPVTVNESAHEPADSPVQFAGPRVTVFVEWPKQTSVWPYVFWGLVAVVAGPFQSIKRPGSVWPPILIGSVFVVAFCGYRAFNVWREQRACRRRLADAGARHRAGDSLAALPIVCGPEHELSKLVGAMYGLRMPQDVVRYMGSAEVRMMREPKEIIARRVNYEHTFWQTRLASFGYEMPEVIVDARFAADIGKIPVYHDLVETEPVISSRSIGAAVWSAVITGLALLGITSCSGWWMWSNPLAKLVLLIVVIGLVFGRLFRALGWRILPTNETLASPGVVESGADRWTIEDSICIIDRANGLRATLIGPKCNLELRFAGASDPGFVTFWQRWNHANPRLDLVLKLADHRASSKSPASTPPST